jgi:hypothetical protein
MNGELEITWKEVVLAYFKVLILNLLDMTKENQEKPLSGELASRWRLHHSHI